MTRAHYFSSQACDPSIHGNQLPLIQFYARKYFHALCVELACLIGREEVDEVIARLNREEPNLKAIAAQTYKQTLENDLEYFLAPELKDVADLGLITELLQQAKDLGCVTYKTNISPADVFEENRKRIYSSNLRILSPRFMTFKKEASTRLQAAQSTFEEIVRLLSWRESLAAMSKHGTTPLQVAEQLRTFKASLTTPTTAAPFIAYTFSRD